MAWSEALGAAVMAWAGAHADATLAAHEAGVRALVQAALPQLLARVVEASTCDLDVGVAGVGRRCPRCDERVRRHGQRVRQVQTTCGRVTLRRSWYACAACGHGFSPADTTLGFPPRARLSPALQAWVVRLGTTTTFREGAALLHELTSLAVAAATLRAQRTVAGTRLADAEATAAARVLATRAAAAAVDAAPGTLVVETDGARSGGDGVRFHDGWHEVKVGLVGGTTADGTLTAPSYPAMREPADRFGPRLLAEAARRGALAVVGWEGGLRGTALARLRPVPVLGDGAAWIWNLADAHFGARTEAVDFYHASHHLWSGGRALYGADTPEAAAWATTWCRDRDDHGPRSVQVALAHARPPADGRETLRIEPDSVRTNAARMDYPSLRDQHLPIGSGAVASAARHLVQHRMKRPGQRWSRHGARAMLARRARHASHRPLTTLTAVLL